MTCLLEMIYVWFQGTFLPTLVETWSTSELDGLVGWSASLQHSPGPLSSLPGEQLTVEEQRIHTSCWTLFNLIRSIPQPLLDILLVQHNCCQCCSHRWKLQAFDVKLQSKVLEACQQSEGRSLFSCTKECIAWHAIPFTALRWIWGWEYLSLQSIGLPQVLR